MNWQDKTVLVTGGTGSFGQKFVQMMLKKHKPKKLIVFSRDELKQSEMERKFVDPCLRFFIGDIRDEPRLMRAFEGVDIVVHAAALKQVPAMEYNPFEAVKTNIFGSQNIINAAIERNVSRVLLISSDKAVSPANLYGATKLCAERLFVNGNSYAGAKHTRFCVVRYGNVVGSRGSVLHVFRETSKNGSIPITDERMTRFWITLEQGVNFVIKCVELTKGGEIFIPKIPSMKIIDLAKIISPGSKTNIIGIRPGEKLHESLLTEEESRRALEFDDLFLIKPENPSWETTAWTGGKPMRDFRYSSDTNKKWLTTDEMKKMIEEFNT